MYYKRALCVMQKSSWWRSYDWLTLSKVRSLLSKEPCFAWISCQKSPALYISSVKRAIYVVSWPESIQFVAATDPQKSLRHIFIYIYRWGGGGMIGWLEWMSGLFWQKSPVFYISFAERAMFCVLCAETSRCCHPTSAKEPWTHVHIYKYVHHLWCIHDIGCMV